MEVWAVYKNVQCEVDGDSEIIEELEDLCITEELANNVKKECEDSQIKWLKDLRYNDWKIKRIANTYSVQKLIVREE